MWGETGVTPETKNLEISSLQLLLFIAIIVLQITIGFVSIIVLLTESRPVDPCLYDRM